MTNQRIEKLIQESERMLEFLQKDTKYKCIYKDVNFRQIKEKEKIELMYRENPFKELTIEEQNQVSSIFS